MINEKAQEHIFSAIEMEIEAAISNRGYFHTDHEAWAVLKEEIEELLELFDEDKIYVDIDNLWGKIRRDEPISEGDLYDIYKWAQRCAEEAVQVFAMCLKWGESNEQRKQEEG